MSKIELDKMRADVLYIFDAGRELAEMYNKLGAGERIDIRQPEFRSATGGRMRRSQNDSSYDPPRPTIRDRDRAINLALANGIKQKLRKLSMRNLAGSPRWEKLQKRLKKLST